MNASRREFLKTSAIGAGLGLLGGAGVAGCATSVKGDFAPKSGRRVVVIGGGWGGATAAKYVRLLDPIDRGRAARAQPGVRLVPVQQSRAERRPDDREPDLQLRRPAPPRREGHPRDGDCDRARHASACAWARAISSTTGSSSRRASSSSGSRSRGWPRTRTRCSTPGRPGRRPWSWPSSSQSMSDGGVFVLTVPPVAYRCPPGPYERICQVAWYLKNNKPKSKLIVLDANQNIVSKTALFRAAWQAYPNIEYRASSKVVGGRSRRARSAAPSSTGASTTCST